MVDMSGQAEQTRLLALLFADYAEVTTSGKAVVAGVFDQLLYQSGVASPFYIYARIVQSAPETVMVSILNPTGIKLGEMILKPPDGFVPKETPYYMQIAARSAVLFAEPGLYWFDVTCGGERLGLVPLRIGIAPEETDGSTNGSTNNE